MRRPLLCSSAVTNIQFGASKCVFVTSELSVCAHSTSSGSEQCRCERCSSTNHATRTVLSHRRVAVIDVGLLRTVAYVNPAYCRCRLITFAR